MLEHTESYQPPPCFKQSSKQIAIAIVLLGCLILLGWIFEIRMLKCVCFGDANPIKANTAISLIFSGLSLWMRHNQPQAFLSRLALQTLPICVIIIGLLTSSQYLFGWDSGIDQLLFQDSFASASKFPPGRMALNTATGFLFLGTALALSNEKGDCQHRIAQILTLFVALIAFVAIIGYVYQIPSLQGLTAYNPKMPLFIALAFIILCCGILSLHPEQRLIDFFASSSSSNITARWLFIVAISIPLILGWLILQGQQAGYFDTAFSVALLIIEITIAFVILIFLNALLAERMENDRQRTVNALQESDRSLSLALDAANLGSWDWNLLADTLIWSPNLYLLFGKTPDSFDCTYQAFLDCIYPGDREIVTKAIELIRINQQKYSQEFRILLPDKSIRWIASKGQFFYDQTGQAVRMNGVSIDITASKLLEQEQKQLLELEKEARTKSENTNRIKDEFLSVVSHELRTPLNSILGWSKILRTGSLDSKKVNQGLETIERNARAQLQIVEDLLNISLLVQAQLQLNICEINLISVINAAIDIVRPSAKAKNIYIETVYNEWANPIITGDFTRLRQVIYNLLANAIKFTPSGGYIKISLDRTGSFANIYVSDTGKGITTKFLPYVFDRFRQEDSSTTRAFGGLGLGLAIIRSLVELHGGNVSVKSAGKNLGTIFLVKLPIKSTQKTDLSKKSGFEGYR
jgi:signal transduction histidine kinase